MAHDGSPMRDNYALGRRCRDRAALASGKERSAVRRLGCLPLTERSWRGALAWANLWSLQEVKRAVLLWVLLLAGCGDTQTAFVSEGNPDQSISLIREQSHLGGPWKSTLIVAGLPQCQRRYALQEADADNIRIDVYRPGPGYYILKSGKRWDVVEIGSCGYQTYKTPPPEPGELAGSFEISDGKLRYAAKASAARAARPSR